MQKRTRKLLALLLASLMMLTLFAACADNGGGTPAGTSAASTPETSAPATSAPDAGTTPAADEDDGSETFEYTWIGYAYSEASAGDDATIRLMLEDKFNIKLTPVFVDRTNYAELMNLKFASGDIPDVFTAQDSQMLAQWVNQGVLGEMKLGDIQKYAPAIWEDLTSFESIDPNITKYGIVDGVNYGLQLTSVDVTYRAPVVWRTDWLKNVGINKMPETLEEFKTALYAFAKNDPDGNGQNDTFGLHKSGLAAMYGVAGAEPNNWYVDADGQVKWGGIKTEMKDILALFQAFYKDGVLDPEFITGENQGGYWPTSQPFTNGRIGLSCLGSYYHWNPPYGVETEWTSTNGKLFKELQGTDATYDFGTPAVGADGQSGMIASTPATALTVIKDEVAENPKKIQRMLKFQNAYCEDKQLYIDVRWGTEGVHYTWDANGMIKGLTLAEGVKKVDELGGSFNFMNYNSMKWFTDIFAPQFDFAEKVTADHRIYNPIRGVLPSQATYKAELDKMQEMVYTGIITGEKDISEFDKFVTDWLAQGGEQLTAEANEWYNNITSLTAE